LLRASSGTCANELVACSNLEYLCFLHLYHPTVTEKALFFGAVPSVCLTRQILLPEYIMNVLNSFQNTDKEYLLAPTDDLIRFLRSKVKVTAGCRGGKSTHLDDGALKSFFSFVMLCNLIPAKLKSYFRG